MKIGVVIKNLRKAKKITQKELSKQADICQGSLSLIENHGRSPYPSTLKRLAKPLGTTPFMIILASAEIKDVPNQREFKRIVAIINNRINKKS